MSTFDAMVANLFESTTDGRRIYRPWVFGRRVAYQVTPADCDRVVRITKLTMIGEMVVFIPLIATMAITDHWLFYPIGLLALILTTVASQWYAVRGLPRFAAGKDAIVILSWKEQARRAAIVMGKRETWGMLVGAVLMDAGQVYIAVTDGDWWAWVGTAPFTTCVVYFAWQLTLIYRRGS